MRSTSYRHRISGLAAIGGVLLLVAACSSAGASTAPSAAAVPSSAPSAAPSAAGSGGAGAAIAIAMATGTVGDYLTGEDGKTLYVFTRGLGQHEHLHRHLRPDLAAVRGHRRCAQPRRRRDRRADDLRPARRHDAGRDQRHSRSTTTRATRRPATRPARASSASGSSPRRPARRRPAPRPVVELRGRLLSSPAAHAQQNGPRISRGPFHVEPRQPAGVSQTG